MKMPRNKSNIQETVSNTIQGLSLTGTVIDRTRRMVPRDNPTTEIVTYTIQDDCNRKFFVDDYAPDGYHNINSTISIPVYVKAYIRKNGDPSFTLNVQKPEVRRGEHF